MKENSKVYIKLADTKLLKVNYDGEPVKSDMQKTIDDVSIRNITENTFEIFFSRNVLMAELFSINITLVSKFNYKKLDKEVDCEKYLNSKIEEIIRYTPMIDIAIMLIAQLSSVDYVRPFISNFKIEK